MITMIPRSKLEPHPDNPRKDLGDLSELSASIAKQGLLQNLTVVPSPDDPGKYRIVIGHRRFAASEKAGLTELPCSIDEKMTYPEQIAVMMSENIQRNDLTVTERVGGVQMMMDLGMDIAEIAGNTGISDTTVRRYAKLTKLDRGGMKDAEARGATLLQFAEIAEIESDDLREDALNSVGTPEFQHIMWKARTARDRTLRLPLMKAKLDVFATEAPASDFRIHRWVNNFSFSSEKDCEKISRPKPDSDYVYVVGESQINLYEVDKPADDSEEQAKREAAERIRLRVNHEREVAAGFRKMRDSYMSGISLRGREVAAKRFVLWVLTRNGFLSTATIGGLFQEIFLSTREDQPESYTSSIVVSNDEVSAIPEKALLTALVLVAYDRITGCDMTLIDRYSGNPKSSEQAATLHGLYTHMESLGYPISTAEREWLNGTHECFSYTGEHAEEGE